MHSGSIQAAKVPSHTKGRLSSHYLTLLLSNALKMFEAILRSFRKLYVRPTAHQELCTHSMCVKMLLDARVGRSPFRNHEQYNEEHF